MIAVVVLVIIATIILLYCRYKRIREAALAGDIEPEVMMSAASL